jgi:hypothetical protein
MWSYAGLSAILRCFGILIILVSYKIPDINFWLVLFPRFISCFQSLFLVRTIVSISYILKYKIYLIPVTRMFF